MTQAMNPDFESKHDRGQSGKFVRMERTETEVSGLTAADSFEDKLSRSKAIVGDLIASGGHSDYRVSNFPNIHDVKTNEALAELYPDSSPVQRAKYIKYEVLAEFYAEGGEDFMMDVDKNHRYDFMVDPDSGDSQWEGPDRPGEDYNSGPDWQDWADRNAERARTSATLAAMQCADATNVRRSFDKVSPDQVSGVAFVNHRTRRGDASDAPYETLQTSTYVRRAQSESETPRYEVVSEVKDISHRGYEDFENPVRTYSGTYDHGMSFDNEQDAVRTSERIGTHPPFDEMRVF